MDFNSILNYQLTCDLLKNHEIIWEKFLKKKPFVSREFQVKILKKRNLTFSMGEDAAARILSNIPYYKLVNGFKNNAINLSDKNSEDFLGYDFNDLLDLYNFDRNISMLIFKYILLFEESFISTLSHHVSDFYGYKEEAYLDQSKYRDGKITTSGKTEKEITFSNINNLLADRKKIILHYKDKHANVPPWILFQHLDFGNKKFFYKLLEESLKSKIVYHYLNRSNKKDKWFFMFALNMMNTFRNCAAHGDIVSNSNFIFQPDIIKENFVKGLNSGKYKYKQFNKGYGTEGLFCLILCMNRLFRNRYTVKVDFKEEIESAFNEFKEINPRIYFKLLEEMNLPKEFLEFLD